MCTMHYQQIAAVAAQERNGLQWMQQRPLQLFMVSCLLQACVHANGVKYEETLIMRLAP